MPGLRLVLPFCPILFFYAWWDASDGLRRRRSVWDGKLVSPDLARDLLPSGYAHPSLTLLLTQVLVHSTFSHTLRETEQELERIRRIKLKGAFMAPSFAFERDNPTGHLMRAMCVQLKSSNIIQQANHSLPLVAE